MPNKINLDISTRTDIVCRKGDTFSLDMDINDSSGVALDLTSYVFKMEVRETDDADTTILASTDFSFTADANGNLVATVPAATMASIDSGVYVYDLQATVAGVVRTWLHGIFTVKEDVTV